MNIDRIQPGRFGSTWGPVGVRWSLCVSVLTVVALTLLPGCRVGSGEEVPASGQIMPIPADSFAMDWTALVKLDNKQKLKALWISDSRIFAATTDNRVYWLDRARGSIITSNPAAKPQDVLFPPVTMIDRVVFPSTSNLYIFNPNGRQTDMIKLPYGASSGAVGEKDLVFIGLDDPAGNRISAIEVNEGGYDLRPHWELATFGQVAATATIYQGNVFVGSRNGGVFAVRADNRIPLWPGLEHGYFKTGEEIVANLTSDKDGVYVASMDAKLYCLDMNNGRVRWVYYAGMPLGPESAPVVTPGHVYLYVPRQGIVAIDKATKQEVRKAQWNVPEARQFLAIDDKHVYLRSADNSILAVEIATGQVKFRSKRSDYSLFAVNNSTKDNTIYAATTSGAIYAIKPVLTGGTVGELALMGRPLPMAAR